MQEEDFPAADRIISLIEAVFKRDLELREFDIIISHIDDNTCPVVHVRSEHCFGIKSWCVKPLYKFVYQELLKIRENKTHKRQALFPEERQRCENLLNTALLLHPEVATFWNTRRELATRGHLDPYMELKFCSLVSSFKPKTADVFVYRRWILSSLLKDLSEADRTRILTSELEAVYRAATKYPNNYNAWNHAHWCLELATPDLKLQLLYLSDSWMSSHVSDHSVMQFRQQLLQNVPELDWCQGSLYHFIHELASNSQLIASYPGHEALWYHRRFLVHELGVRCDPNLVPCLREQERQAGVSPDDADYKLKHLRWMDKFLLPREGK
ncbi:hypothetical protein M8J76_005071 [Diaphorina citri]|nr:hypothetical protein M8J76_005071 [Diaphorina citri]